jgi:hypothetical protein
MPALTVFSAPKPFTNPHIAVIQRNAIQSWLRLPDVQVILVGDEPGLAEAAAGLGVLHLPQVACNEAGTPLISSIFALARQASQSPLLAYTNADMLYTPDLAQAAGQAAGLAERFLVVGQRWDLDVTQALDFGPGWEASLRARVAAEGRLHPPAGSDYFIFPRPAFEAMPAFAVGRAGWDNWMIYHACSQGWAVVDATESILAVHQNHDYSHLPGGRPHYDLAESQHNIALAGGAAHLYTMLDTNARLIAGRLQPPALSLARWVRRAELALMPPENRRSGPLWWLVRRLRRWRKRLSG